MASVDRIESRDSVELAKENIEREIANQDYIEDDSNLPGPSPTEEELTTLRKIADTLPTSAWLVAVVELCERFTYYGVSGVFQNYMQIPLDSKRQNGALGLGQSKATALSYFFQFWCYVTPILGAVIADKWLGKYKTICVFAGIYIIGTLVLFVTSLPTALEHGAGLGGLIAAMIIIGLGTGGIKSNVSPLIADQYTITKPYIKTLKNGERVVVDPALTVQSVFMIFYFCINLGSLSAIATTEMEKNINFWAAYLLPFCFFFVGIAALIIGRNKYIKRPAMGSVIPDAFKIIMIGATNGFNLDKAKPSVRNADGQSEVQWSDLFVDEVRRSVYACKVFLFYPVYWVVYGQMINNFVSQADQMELHGLPNDIMQNIDPIAIMVFIPIMERIVYPALRKIGIQCKPITRIFWGFVFASLSMAYSAIVQHLIYSAGPCYDHPLNCPASMDGVIPNKVHVAIQTPAYFFIAISEIMASITGLEYAYTKAPANMKSFIMSLFLLTNALGAAIGMALSSTAVDPKLVWMFTGLAIATLISGFIFWFLFRSYNQLEEELNVIDADYAAEMNAEIKHNMHAHGNDNDAEKQNA
ncbi:Ptr2p [Sugiyamaella lignohabitans]|uniref:Ptr2p n=1 Tax=Sugiyamaella lignohabitans TaxID=796027 RepID=A0A167FH59_9ASCO|nr:Ptr2p [Sugiyamaella lignohabitans]ANB15292.1 Ptr2p [Sugiyamaella lignohabitans]